ncbi:response regulator transcription factor [Leucothrix arctica]|uniref:DNA-binding response regulator n=1 Tax=Leucothrix arctica TaxID=1481894 RepID=A0A317CER8_9GAMM|nr:response regulator transcription factor [Leucothrix arctica]PWQ97155.1 hypothetical protein DKT75_07520 [Leucothrix arctica]
MQRITPSESKKRILIVEDDVILLDFLEMHLSINNYDATCLSEDQSIPQTLEKKRFDIVVLDVMLPGKSGLYWLQWMKQYHPNIIVIMMSARSDKDDRLKGLECGAHDYIIKPFKEEELLIRIANIFKSVPYFKRRPTVVNLGDIKFDMDKNRILREDGEIRLTVLESGILKLLYLNAGITLSRDEISEQVRGAEHNPLDRSIDIHINKLRKKIEIDPSDPLFILTRRGKGYIFKIPESS